MTNQELKSECICGHDEFFHHENEGKFCDVDDCECLKSSPARPAYTSAEKCEYCKFGEKHEEGASYPCNRPTTRQDEPSWEKELEDYFENFQKLAQLIIEQKNSTSGYSYSVPSLKIIKDIFRSNLAAEKSKSEEIGKEKALREVEERIKGLKREFEIITITTQIMNICEKKAVEIINSLFENLFDLLRSLQSKQEEKR